MRTTCPPSSLSGQAVIEGVVIRAPGSFAVAVRRSTGEIVVRERPWRRLQDRWPVLRLPILRGIASLVDGALAGFEGLSFAAEQVGLHGPLAPAAIDSVGRPLRERRAAIWSIGLSAAVALISGAALFVVLPHLLAACLARLVGGVALQSVAFQAMVGGCKLVIFIAYVLLMGTLPDIRRLFMYHGAEHKVLAAHDAGRPLDLAHVRHQSMRHDHCGTSFLLMLVLLAIVLFAVVFPLMPGLGYGWRSHLVAMAVKVPMMLPLAGLAFELNTWAAANMHRSWVRIVAAPGFWLQRLTVREPSDDMLEVALAALRAALSRGRRSVVTTSSESTLVYQNFADVCARQV